MILNEAIERYTSNAEYERIHGNLQGCLDFRQLAEWLKDYKRLLEQEPKTGHWIYDNYNWRCSECNETPKTLGYVGTADFMTEHFKFCNHCGARMVEPQERSGEE